MLGYFICIVVIAVPFIPLVKQIIKGIRLLTVSKTRVNECFEILHFHFGKRQGENAISMRIYKAPSGSSDKKRMYFIAKAKNLLSSLKPETIYKIYTHERIIEMLKHVSQKSKGRKTILSEPISIKSRPLKGFDLIVQGKRISGAVLCIVSELLPIFIPQKYKVKFFSLTITVLS